MALLYETLAANGVLLLDQNVLHCIRAKSGEQLKKLDERIADAEENLGETEVREAHLAKSFFLKCISDKEKALEQLKVTEGKTVAVNQKDLVFYSLLIGFFYMDFDPLSKSIDKARSLFKEGGDWERKNRLKVYEGLFCSIISLDRVPLNQKVIDAPEILAVIGKIPHLSEMREVRTVVYSQFLESYKSVTIEAMANEFGALVDFIDMELARFIAEGNLHCKIDKAAGV